MKDTSRRNNRPRYRNRRSQGEPRSDAPPREQRNGAEAASS